MEIQDARSFQYYLPHASTDSTDQYADASGIAFSRRDVEERAEMEEMLLEGFDLPFVDEDDFNYYPERSPRPLCAVSTESLVAGDSMKEVESGETAESAKRRLKFREAVVGLAKKLTCKQ